MVCAVFIAAFRTNRPVVIPLISLLFQGETDAECAAKAAYAIKNGISVMGCIGETMAERESG